MGGYTGLIASVCASVSILIGTALGDVVGYKFPETSFQKVACFTSGVLVMAATVDFFPQGLRAMSELSSYPEILATIFYSSGWLLAGLITKLIGVTMGVSHHDPWAEMGPDFHDDLLNRTHVTVTHYLSCTSSGTSSAESLKSYFLARERLMAVAAATTVSVALHNIVEGIAMFATARTNMKTGMVMMVAIVAHNIPEGLAIGATMKASSGNRLWIYGSGIFASAAGVLGSLIGWLSFSGPSLGSQYLFAVMILIAGGTLLNIGVSELLPVGFAGEPGKASRWWCYGMVFILVSNAILSMA